MLEKNELFLPAVATLNDSYEGSAPLPMVKERDAMFEWVEDQFQNLDAGEREERVYEMKRNLSLLIRRFRHLSYVSCWHMNEYESEAMWRLYCGNKRGVAIRTTYASLSDATRFKDSNIGKVSYIDYSTTEFETTLVDHYFMHKRISFKHENEVRVVFMDMEAILSPVRREEELDLKRSGVSIEIEPESFIDTICVHPYSEDWYEESVRATVACLCPSLKERIKSSSIGTEPIFI